MSEIPAALTEIPVWLPWRPGPAQKGEQAVVISLTDFRPDRLRDVPAISLAALRLREGWYAMPGAIGLWVWQRPLEKGRAGSVSVWRSDADLRRFVALPAHAAIMRKYRTLGTLKSATWEMDNFTPVAARAAAQRRIVEWGAPT
jgi:heme-degrading monooxygenase HmoA